MYNADIAYLANARNMRANGHWMLQQAWSAYPETQQLFSDHGVPVLPVEQASTLFPRGYIPIDVQGLEPGIHVIVGPGAAQRVHEMVQQNTLDLRLGDYRIPGDARVIIHELQGIPARGILK
jgi:hypothetical protein